MSTTAWALLAIAASVILVPLVVILGPILLALVLLAAGVLVGLILVVAVPGLLVLLAGGIIRLEMAVSEMVRRRWFPKQAIQRGKADPPATMSPQDEILDSEFSKQITYQLEELIAQRTEFMTLTGFLAVIAAATFAVQPAFIWSGIFNLILFLGAAYFGQSALDTYPPEYADPDPLLEAVVRSERFKMAPESPSSLRALAYGGRAEAYQANRVSIKKRKRLLTAVRGIIVVAVLALGSTAVAEAKPGKDAQTMSMSIKTTHQADGR